MTAAAKTAVIAAAAAEAKAAVAAAGIVAVEAQAAEFSTTAVVVPTAAAPPASGLGLEPFVYWPYSPRDPYIISHGATPRNTSRSRRTGVHWKGSSGT